MQDNTPPTLESLISQGRALLRAKGDAFHAHRNFEAWDEAVARYLAATYPDSGKSARWSSLETSPLVVGKEIFSSPGQWMGFEVAVRKRLNWLGSCQATPLPASANDNQKLRSKEVFVVHGHDEAIREKVARFLEKLGLTPIILHEKANRGRTIIEKFTEHSNVAFAVVLLTPDDFGRQKNATPSDDSPRARQNVIFELGYFMGKLGRDRVAALHSPGVEILSDFSGVAYIPIEPSDAWQLLLARELSAAGLPIDMNDAL